MAFFGCIYSAGGIFSHSIATLLGPAGSLRSRTAAQTCSNWLNWIMHPSRTLCSLTPDPAIGRCFKMDGRSNSTRSIPSRAPLPSQRILVRAHVILVLVLVLVLARHAKVRPGPHLLPR